MALPEYDSASLNVQLFVDAIPALITTASPDGCLDYLKYLATLHDPIGWKWAAFVHPEDVAGMVDPAAEKRPG